MFYTVLTVATCLFAASTLASTALGQQANPSSRLVVDYQPPAKSYALIIGNDSYPGHSLQKARSDATLVTDALTKHGFEVDLAHDLNSKQMRQRIRDFFDYNGQHPDARLLLWFAGHGATIDMRGERHGFLLPIDSPVEPTAANRAEIINKAVDVIWLRNHIQKFVQSRHVMVIFDSCFAGAVFAEPTDRKRGSDTLDKAPLPERWGNAVRQFIVAGTIKQEVFDDGLFARVFVEAISGQSPTLRPRYPGYLTGQELGEHIHDHFKANRKGVQHPVSRKIPSGVEHDGEFVFGVKPTEKGGKWRIVLDPRISASMFGRDQPELVELAQRCAVGRRHRASYKATQEVFQHTDVRRHTVVHTYESGQTNPRTGQPVSIRAMQAYSIERDGGMLRIRYGDSGESGEMLLYPIEDEQSAVPDDYGNFLLQGAWARDGGTGCAEIRLNVRTREGRGLIWLGLRNRFGVEIKRVTKEPLKSTLKIYPNAK